MKKSMRIWGLRNEERTEGSCNFLRRAFFCGLVMGALSALYHCLSDMAADVQAERLRKRVVSR